VSAGGDRPSGARGKLRLLSRFRHARLPAPAPRVVRRPDSLSWCPALHRRL